MNLSDAKINDIVNSQVGRNKSIPIGENYGTLLNSDPSKKSAVKTSPNKPKPSKKKR